MSVFEKINNSFLYALNFFSSVLFRASSFFKLALSKIFPFFAKKRRSEDSDTSNDSDNESFIELDDFEDSHEQPEVDIEPQFEFFQTSDNDTVVKIDSDSESSEGPEAPIASVEIFSDKKNPCPCEVSKKIKEIIDPVVFQTRESLNVIYEDGTVGVPLDSYKKTSASYIEKLESQLPPGTSRAGLIERTYQLLGDEYHLDNLLSRQDAYPRCNVGDFMRDALLEHSREFRGLSETQQINVAKVAGASYVATLLELVSPKMISAINKEYAQEVISFDPDPKKNQKYRRGTEIKLSSVPVVDDSIHEKQTRKSKSTKTLCFRPAAARVKSLLKKSKSSRSIERSSIS